MLNEKVVLIYLESQKNRVEFEDTIEEEYVEKVYFPLLLIRNSLILTWATSYIFKVIMFGFIVVSGNKYLDLICEF